MSNYHGNITLNTAYQKCIQKIYIYRLEIAQKRAIEAIADPFLATYAYHGDRHEHNTRHITDASRPSVNSNVMHRSFLYLGPFCG